MASLPTTTVLPIPRELSDETLRAETVGAETLEVETLKAESLGAKSSGARNLGAATLGAKTFGVTAKLYFRDPPPLCWNYELTITYDMD